MFSMKRPSLILAALAIAACALAAPPASASSSASAATVLEDCHERFVVVPGVEKLVRERVPPQFELVRDPRRRPLLAVLGARWERLTAGGATRATKFGFFAAIIESPDGAGCQLRWPVLGGAKPDLVPLCNVYSFFHPNSHPGVVSAFRGLFPDSPVHYVPDLVFEEGEFDLARRGAPFRFRAGAPTPSPYEINAVTRPGQVRGPLTATFWASGAVSGTVGYRFELHDFAPGQMDATLRVAPGSEMAALLGTETPTPIFGLANRYRRAEGRLLSPVRPKRTTPVCKGRPATIVGSGRMNGTAGDDVIVGGEGRDLIDGLGGDDRICAGRGPDRLRGGQGRDRFYGGPGRDRITATGGGRDIVDCGPGRDRVWADRRDRLRRCERVRRRR